MRLYVLFCLEMILMDTNMKWQCIFGRSVEDKHSIKKDKQSIIVFKSYMKDYHQIYFWNNMSIMILYVFFWPGNYIDG